MATEYVASIPTSAGDSPVQEIHRCNSEHRPVQLTTPTGEAVAPQDVSSASKRSTLASADADAGESDDLRTAITTVCGLDAERLTSSARAALNKAVREIITANGTVDEVLKAARSYRRQMPNAMLTPAALAKHWPKLLGPEPTNGVIVMAGRPMTPAMNMGRELGLTISDLDEVRTELSAYHGNEDVEAGIRAWGQRRKELFGVDPVAEASAVSA